LSLSLTVPLALAACTAGSPPAIDHVVVLFLENRGFEEIIGNANAPYLNSLAQSGAWCSNFYALTHPSQPNYFEFFGGSNQGILNNANPPSGAPFSTPNLGTALMGAGATFVSYAEALPYVGYAGPAWAWYTRLVVPCVSWQSPSPGPNQLPYSVNRQFSEFESLDFSQLPTVCTVVPTLGHSMHDNSVASGDAWVQQHIGPYAQWAMSNNSLLIVTFDEDSTVSRNRIATIFYGPMVRPGTIDASCTHHDLLRTLCDLYGAPAPGQGARARTIPGIFSSDDMTLRRTFRQGASGYSSVHDTWISPATPNSPANTTTYMQVGNGRQALVRFENLFGNGPGQVPAGATILSAKLTMPVGGDKSVDTFSLHRMLTAWPDTCTWNSLGNGVSTDGVEAAAEPEFEVIPNIPQMFTFFDVTAAAQGWSDGSQSNFGFVLRSAGSDLAEFRPSEYSASTERPMLEITYSNGSPCVAFTAQPQAQAVLRGQSASFTAAASSADPLTYHWRRNGTPLADGGGYSGVTTSTLTVSPADFAHAGVYAAEVSSSCASIVSSSAALVVNCDIIPGITQQPPATLRIPLGSPAAAATVLTAPGPLQYRWQRLVIQNFKEVFVDISDTATTTGTDTPVLSFSSVGHGDTGRYRLKAASDCAEAFTTSMELSAFCRSDVNNDGYVNGDDFDAFTTLFEIGDAGADYDDNGFVNGEDFDLFVQDFESGC